MAKKITITLEVTRVVAIHTRTTGPAWCDQRAAEREKVVLEKSEPCGERPEALESWLTSAGLPRLPLWNQWPLVYLHSLLARMRKPKPR